MSAARLRIEIADVLRDQGLEVDEQGKRLVVRDGDEKYIVLVSYAVREREAVSPTSGTAA